MNIREECAKAAGIAARVLELKTPFILTFDEAEEKIRIGREAVIHIDLEHIPPVNLYGDLGIVVGGEMEVLFGAIFETYRQVRFLYQKTTLTVFYRNQQVGFQLFPQPESDQTCAEWDQELNGFFVRRGESVTDADATAFAVYMFHRYPIRFPIKKTDRQIGKMKRRYRYKEIPESFNAPVRTL